MLKRNLAALSEMSRERWRGGFATRRRTLLIVAVVAAIVLFPDTWRRGPVHAQKANSPGMEPYTPTKLEWLALECGVGLASGSELETRFVDVGASMKEPDTIVMFAVYTPNVDRKY